METVSSWPRVLGQLLRGQDLEPAQAQWAMSEVLAGEASPAQLAGFVVALRAKGETAGEVAGLAAAMLAAAVAVPLGDAVRRPVVDTCGTGGDGADTVNISTLAALVVAGCGLAVVKHGNRAASSSCGSADLLEELGVRIDLAAPAVAACLERAGIAFCFAPVFHPAMRHAAGTRRELGVPTVFNVLGPLTNPAQPDAQVVGVADAGLAPVLAGVLARRGTAALVVHGSDGLDELSTRAPSEVWAVRGGQVRRESLDPAALGLTAPGSLAGGDAAHNARLSRAFLAGELGAIRDAVLLNAAAALVAAAGAGPAGGSGSDWASVQEAIGDALPRAADAVDSGAAAAVLERWVRVSQDLASGPAG